MKTIPSSPCQSRAIVALPATRRHAFDAGAATDLHAAGAQVLATPRPSAGSSFLAQYLAQEIIGPDDPQPRWRDRDNAYRLAANPSAASSIMLDI